MYMDTYMFGKWQPMVPIKITKNQRVLHFHNMADVSRLLSLGLRFILIEVISLA